MYAQDNKDSFYEVIDVEESLSYDIRNLKDHKYCDFNASTALLIDDNKIPIFPDIAEGSCLITTKAQFDKMFSDNSFPVLPENDTLCFRYKNWMNKHEFNIDNINIVLKELNLVYNKSTFYANVEKLSKTLSEYDRKKLLLAMLYFIGEDLRTLYSTAELIQNIIFNPLTVKEQINKYSRSSNGLRFS